MRLVYTFSARDDLLWLRRYYSEVFPDGVRRALHHLVQAEEMLLRHPQIGRPTEYADVRELPIARTPFSMIYQIAEDEIRILRIWDNRVGTRPFVP